MRYNLNSVLIRHIKAFEILPPVYIAIISTHYCHLFILFATTLSYRVVKTVASAWAQILALPYSTRSVLFNLSVSQFALL